MSNQLKQEAWKEPILTWKSKKIGGALVTKIGSQRYLGLERKDKTGQIYWKYYPLTKTAEPSVPSSPKQPNSEPPSPTVELNSESSEQVKKFREKFGEFSVK